MVMKQVKEVNVLHNSPNDRIYMTENGLCVRDITICAGVEEPVYIGFLSDIHFNLCNQQDFDEADPVILSTYENRKWLANGASVPNAQRCFAFLDDVDQIVLCGDTLDYLSHGCMELMQREVWDAHPDVLAVMGGHEVARRMQGKVADPTTRESRLERLKAYWKHDIYYESRLLNEKVRLIGLFNDLASYSEEQEKRLTEDIQDARKNNRVILIFEHEGIRTMNPNEECVRVEDLLTKGDTSGFPMDFYRGASSSGGKLAGNDACDEQTKRVYDLIVNNADVIRGVFAGHHHDDVYTEITAKKADGTPCVIPQFIHTATAYDNGHLMRITVK